MTNGASHWRMAEEYRHIETLKPSDIAWEFLRRNPDYIRDYEEFAGSDHPAMIAGDICRRWGLRFPGQSNAPST